MTFRKSAVSLAYLRLLVCTGYLTIRLCGWDSSEPPKSIRHTSRLILVRHDTVFIWILECSLCTPWTRRKRWAKGSQLPRNHKRWLRVQPCFGFEHLKVSGREPSLVSHPYDARVNHISGACTHVPCLVTSHTDWLLILIKNVGTDGVCSPIPFT